MINKVVGAALLALAGASSQATLWDCGNFTQAYAVQPYVLEATLEEIQSTMGLPVDPHLRLIMQQGMNSGDPGRDMSAGLGIYFNHFFFESPYREAKWERQLTRGESATAPLYLATHVLEEHQEALAKVLENNPHGAVAFLTNGHYPLRHRGLLKHGTKVIYSLQGEHVLRISANEIHLAGGYCEQCLQTSVANVLQRNVARGPVTLYVHTSASYSFAHRRPDSHTPSLQEWEARFPDEARRELYREIAANFSRGNPNVNVLFVE